MKSDYLRTLLSIVEFIVTVGLLILITLGFGMQSFHVVGESMTPTLQEQDRLLISKLGRTWSKVKGESYIPERGDIIVFHSPSDDIELVKRVIGLPDERVVLENGKFTIFNDQNPKGFNPDTMYDADEEFDYTAGKVNIVVPEGELFVSGDNREAGGSLDSRNNLGTVPVDLIVGKLSLRIFPVTEARTF